ARGSDGNLLFPLPRLQGEDAIVNLPSRTVAGNAIHRLKYDRPFFHRLSIEGNRPGNLIQPRIRGAATAQEHHAMYGSRRFISVLVCNRHESLDERKAEFPLAASKRVSIISGRLAPGPAAQGLVNAGINTVGNKAHRAIAEQAIHPARMQAAQRKPAMRL